MSTEDSVPAEDQSSENNSGAPSSTHEIINVTPTGGKLRLALSFDSGSLIISVLEAADVSIPADDTACNPYVKISLIPAIENRSIEHRTKVVIDNKDPAFRETFLVNIDEEDSKRRLLIGLWNQGDVEDSQCGGLSFDIESYTKPHTNVNGWFHLLGNAEAETSNSRCVDTVKNHIVSSKSISLAADKRDVRIQRNPKGLGFAVVNDNPVIVTSVENGGPAAAGGLLKGDIILTVNEKEVSSLSCAYVSKLLRQCGDVVEMVVQQGFQSFVNDIKIMDYGAPREMLNNPCCNPDLVNGGLNSTDEHLPPVVLDWETLPPLEQKRQQAIQDLIRSEDNYLTDLRFGIERYLTPLNDEILPAEQHEKLFNNIKDVCEITRKVLKSLTISRVPLINTTPNLPFYIYSIGEVYRENNCHLVAEYERYLGGRKAAHREYTSLKKNPEFLNFLQQPPALPDLCNILQQPREHIGSLPCLLQAVLSNTPLHHPDQAHLGHVIQVLSTLSRTSPIKRRSEARKMADIQERLIFSSNVKPFPIKEGERVLVHEGSLYKIDRKKKHKVYAMLFTDLLLLTKEVGAHLKVIQEPMYLSQLMIQDFNCDDGTEFHITVVTTQDASQCQGGESDKVIHGDTYVLRGKTVESKELWKEFIGRKAGGVNKIRKRDSLNIHTLPCLPTNPTDFDGGSDEDIRGDIVIYGVEPLSMPSSNGGDRQRKAFNKTHKANKPTPQEAKKWSEKFENLLADPKGLAHFNQFVQKEYCSENLDFWVAVNEFREKNPQGDRLKRAVNNIFDTYIKTTAERQVNVNGKTRQNIIENKDAPTITIFDEAQKQILKLMKDHSYSRFIQDEQFQMLIRGQG